VLEFCPHSRLATYECWDCGLCSEKRPTWQTSCPRYESRDAILCSVGSCKQRCACELRFRLDVAEKRPRCRSIRRLPNADTSAPCQLGIRHSLPTIHAAPHSHDLRFTCSTQQALRASEGHLLPAKQPILARDQLDFRSALSCLLHPAPSSRQAVRDR